MKVTTTTTTIVIEPTIQFIVTVRYSNKNTLSLYYNLLSSFFLYIYHIIVTVEPLFVIYLLLSIF